MIEGQAGGRMTDEPGYLYLLHFDEPLVGGQRPQHYLGWTNNGVRERVRQHVSNGHRAARIVVAAVQAGRTVQLACYWPGTRNDESVLKKRKHGFKAMCPLCQQSSEDGLPVAQC